MSEEKTQILKLIKEDAHWNEQEEELGIDYVAEYKKQTGKDLETGEYVTQ